MSDRTPRWWVEWLLRVFATLVPNEKRKPWLREWRAEWTAAQIEKRPPWGLLGGTLADAWAVGHRRHPATSRGRTHSGAKGVMTLSGLHRELRRSLRSLLHVPVFTLSALITLAIGIGATAAIVTVIDVILIRPLPYPDPERVVRVAHSMDGAATNPMARFAFAFFETESRSFDGIGGYWTPAMYTLSGEDRADRVDGVRVTPGLLTVLGAQAVVGRLFTDADAILGDQSGFLMSHRLWVQRYGRDPDIIGRRVQVEGVSREVLGVLSPEVDLPRRKIDLWFPYVVPTGVRPDDAFRIHALARLADGVDRATAETELQVLTTRLPEMAAFFSIYLDQYGLRTIVRPVREEIVGDIARPLWIVFGAVTIVLLVAMANVTTLFLVRGEAHGREVAIRSALGASRTRLIGHFLAEGVWVALAGGLLGLGLAWLGLRLFVTLAPDVIPRLDAITVDWTTTGAAIGIAIVAAVVLSLYPFLRFGRGSAAIHATRFVGEGRRQAGLGSGFVVLQVALALILLSGAALLVQTFRQLRAVDVGFDAAGILVAELSLPAPSYPEPETIRLFQDRLLEDLSGLPGVQSVALGPSPLEQGGCNGIHVEGVTLQPDQFPPCLPVVFVSPGYWNLLGIRIETGRAFEQPDLNGPTVAVVTKDAAGRLWPQRDPLRGAVRPTPRQGPPWFPVVGIAAPVHGRGPDQPPTDALYLPLGAMHADGWIDRTIDVLVATTPGQELDLTPLLRGAVSRIDAGVPVTVRGSLLDEMARTVAHNTFTLFLLGTAASAALLLGLVGLYGVIAHRVEIRRTEIGVRMVVGARAEQVRNEVLRHSLRLVLSGILIGFLAAVFLTRFLASLLFEVRAGDPILVGVSAATLFLAATAASWIPAHRATRIDPAIILRKE